ncbi:MAG: hypothetical protein RDV41_09775, partial [Planctomycetota bacterium]|nr:hypothetical protein [Planctomycetota bacterium]
MSPSLHKEVARFRHWAVTRDPSHALHFPPEWECDYPHWQDLYAAVAAALESPVTESSKEELLFALARDNEDEVILDLLV